MSHRSRSATAFAAALTAAGLTGATLLGTGPAAASWVIQDGSSVGHARARAMPTGPTPTGSATGSDVNLTWATRTIAPGVPVRGYQIRRYTSGGVEQPVSAGCAGLRTSLSCTDTVLNGSWRYTVTPLHWSWRGAESGTRAVTVAAPLRPAPTLSAKPTNPSGSTSATFAFSASGSGTYQCSLDGAAFTTCASPKAYTDLAMGEHTFAVRAADAVGNIGPATSYTWTIDAVPLATDVQASNGSSTVGRAQSGDTVTFSFSEPIAPGSISTGWTGTARAVTVRINDRTTADDTFTVRYNGAVVSALGTVDLNRTDYFVDDVDFAGTMVLSGSTIVITLGAPDAPSAVGTGASAGTMTWTPGSGAKDLTGNALGNGGQDVSESGTADKEF